MDSLLRLVRTAIVLAAVLIPSVAPAQSARGPGLGGFVSGSFGDGGPAPAIGLSADYRFTPLLGLKIDGSYVPNLDFGTAPVCPPERFCLAAQTVFVRGGTYAVRGRTRSASASMVVELPVRLLGMHPYLAGGGGIANVRRELRDTLFPFTFTRTTTDPMVTMGGGVDVPLGRRLVVGIDVRYERIFADPQFDRPDIDRGLNLTRVGSSIRYRF